MFSLCIPTMDRYDHFLSNYLPNYLENELISEIIITDENGSDIEKIKQSFPNHDKLVLIQNEQKLGPFLNKLKACSHAKNEWIALIDSDNFADHNYFLLVKDYIEKNITNEKNIILAPCKAKPQFNYSHLSGFIYKKGSFQKNKDLENQLWDPSCIPSEVCMNTGNYVIHKYLIDHLDLSCENENIKKSSACDVIYINTLFFEQLDLHMHIVPHLEYEHVVHDESVYKKTHQEFSHFNEEVYQRYRNIV